MKLREHYLKYQATLADTDKTILDLKGTGLLSAIEIEIQATNGTTSCVDHEIHDDVKKIEVVDGSETLESLSMIEWIANNFYELGFLPKATLTEAGNAIQKESCLILFGREIGDPDYYFDPKKFINPQLVIENAFVIHAETGFATGTAKLTVKLYIIEEGQGPQKGFIMRKEKYSFTSAASGDEIVDLPRDYPYRSIGVHAILTTKRPDEIIPKIKLSCDVDKYVPYNTYTDDIMDKLASVFGLAQQFKDLFTADDGEALLDIYDIKKAHIRTNADDHIATIESVIAEKITNGLLSLSAQATPAFQGVAKVCPIAVEGLCPHGLVLLTFNGYDELREPFDVSKYGKVELILTQAIVNAAVKVVLSQVRS